MRPIITSAALRPALRRFYLQQNWPCLDLYALMADCPARYVLPVDGIHMNKAGHELFARRMFELFNDLL